MKRNKKEILEIANKTDSIDNLCICDETCRDDCNDYLFYPLFTGEEMDILEIEIGFTHWWEDEEPPVFIKDELYEVFLQGGRYRFSKIDENYKGVKNFVMDNYREKWNIA